MAIDYNGRIPNNVALTENRRLQRALESWQPNYLRWWNDLGPEGTQEVDVYLRTAISVESDGWAHFTYVKMPDYRWGIFLAQPQAERTISFGDHLGEPVWQEIPGEYRSLLRRLVVASAEADSETAALLREAYAGTYVIPESADVLADAIRELRTDPDLASRFGQNGRQWIVDNYSLETVVGIYDQMVRHVCDGRQ